MADSLRQVGDWIIIGQIGEGGNAVVYYARRNDEPTVAFKVLKEVSPQKRISVVKRPD